MIESGKFFKMTSQDYHFGQGKDWLSKSSLSNILYPDGSPRKFKYAIDNPEDLDIFDLKSEKFNRGTAFHTYFLERDKFDKAISVIPTHINKRTKDGKLEWAAYQDKVKESGQTPIKAELKDTLKAFDKMLNSGEYETARAIIQNPDNFIEMSGFWEDPETGLKLKVRPDIIAPNTIVWDLKTYSTFKKFENQAINLDYDLQAHMCLEGVKAITGKDHKDFGFIVFHIDEAPYDIEVLLCSVEFIASGKEKFDRAMETYIECMEKDQWPGFTDELAFLFPPGWRLKQLEGKAVYDIA